MTLQDEWLFGCLWGRSRIRAHNKLSDLEAEKLSDLSQYNIKTHQSESSSSYLPCELKSIKILADCSRPEFGQANFSCHCSHKATNILHLNGKEFKERPEQLRPFLSLPIPVACSDGYPKYWAYYWPALAKKIHYIKILNNFFVVSCSKVSNWLC